MMLNLSISSLSKELFNTDVAADNDDKTIAIDFVNGPKDLATVTIENDRVVYTLGHELDPIDHPIVTDRYWPAIRAMATGPLFTSARRAGLRGTVRLWLDDRPRGTGLAFSGSANITLIPDSTFWLLVGYRALRSRSYSPWSERERPIFWRGAVSGPPIEPGTMLPRVAMCLALKNDFNFDVGITGGHDLVAIQEAGLLKLWVEPTEFARYRHVIDIDGNSASWSGLFNKLLFGCTVLKLASDQRQWYYDKLIPWVNYVPVNSINELASMGELVLTHEADCEGIAAAGQKLARSITWESAIEDGVAAIAKELARL